MGQYDLASMIYDDYGDPLRADSDSLPANIPLAPAYFWGQHEYYLPLATSFDWNPGARAYGQAPWLPTNDPVNNSPAPYGSYRPYIQVMEAVTTPGGSTPLSTNTSLRVEVANWVVYTAPTLTGSWSVLVQTPVSLAGATYNVTTGAFIATITDIRSEAAGAWSFAFTPGAINRVWDAASPLHGFPATLGAIHCRLAARLTSDNPAIDLTTKYLAAAMTMDFYQTGSSSTPYATMQEPRHKYIPNVLRWFTATDMSQAQMTANSPPLFPSTVLPPAPRAIVIGQALRRPYVGRRTPPRPGGVP